MVDMKFVILFLLAVCLFLWLEGYYWKRTASLLEARVLGRSAGLRTFFDAWLDGRIESRLRKKAAGR
jgi:hypothetical protein